MIVVRFIPDILTERGFAVNIIRWAILYQVRIICSDQKEYRRREKVSKCRMRWMKERYGAFRADSPRENWTQNRTSLAHQCLLTGTTGPPTPSALRAHQCLIRKLQREKTGAYRHIRL